MNLAVIVPALNERQHLPLCVRAILPQDVACLVIDGGSWDGTPRLGADLVGRVWHGPRGLAAQCNYGASRGPALNADLLLFVAADSCLPQGWKEEAIRLFQNPEVVAGGFSLAIDHPSLVYRFIAWGGNFRARTQRMALADQGLLVRRTAFLAAGGMDPRALIPFADLCWKLRDQGEFRMSWLATQTSARKWQTSGVVRVVLQHFLTYLRFCWARSARS